MEELDISFGKHRADTNWKPEYLSWDEFVDRLRKVRRTSETMAQYDKTHNIGRGKIKDGPAFVGGLVRGGRRKKENVDTRSLITLDVDHADEHFFAAVEIVLLGYAYLIYSTHSHRANKPKYRLIIPMDRSMNPDEYAAASRMTADMIGLGYFDKTTFDVHRLMYLPSCSKDAEPVLIVSEDTEPWSVDDVLGMYADWRDPLHWPRHPGEQASRQAAKRMEDPTSKPGVVGAFCRCYSISEAIEAFLPDVYEPVDGSESRYTHVGSSSYGGLVVYDEDTFAYSHHESDPCSGREVNAFDLVRLHKFGHLDERASEQANIAKLPSYIAMLAFATQDGKVKKERLAELLEDYSSLGEIEGEESPGDGQEPDEDAWQELLKMHPKTGLPLPTAGNIEIILSHGELAGIIAFDAFGNAEIVRGKLPWRDRERPGADYEPWLAADDRRLLHWLSKKYAIKGEAAVKNALTEVTRANTIHPIKAYIEGVEWDGQARLESVFIDYLGAEDSHYVRQATRKMLLAAVARIYSPGCKFDEMLVLVGPQGAGKSSLLAKLGRKWFSDSLRTFENKEAGEHLQAGWIFELGELSALKKAELEEVKAFLSKTEDKYRVAYDRIVTDFPRKCVFFGTTNTKDFLQDATGNRRFWPVDLDPKRARFSHWTHLTEDIVAQIWAEALHYYRSGEGLILDSEARKAAEQQQQRHMEVDPREGIIQEWLDTPLEDEWADPDEQPPLRQRVCAAQIWVEALRKKAGDMTRWDARVLCDIIRSIPGWKENRTRVRFGEWGKQTVFDRETK